MDTRDIYTNDKIHVKLADTLRIEKNIYNGGKLQYEQEKGELALVGIDGEIIDKVDLPTERVITNITYTEGEGILRVEFEAYDTLEVNIGESFSSSEYYNKEEVDNKLKNLEADLTDYATIQYVDNAINNLDLGTDEKAVKDIVESYNYVNRDDIVDILSPTEDRINNLDKDILDIKEDLICNIEMPTKYTVGNLQEGTIVKGLSISKIIALMLFGQTAEYPTVVEPSVTYTIDRKYAVLGQPLDALIDIKFDRGSITPSFGTSGYRAGEVKSITLEGTTYTLLSVDYEKGVASISMHVDSLIPGENEFAIVVDYEDGEQPLDSEGDIIAQYEPFKGSVKLQSSVKGLTAAYVGGAVTEAIFKNLDLITYEKDIDSNGWFELADGYGYQVVLEDVEPANRSDHLVIMLPSYLTVTGVKFFDPFTSSYVWMYESQDDSLSYLTQEKENGVPTIYTKRIEGVDVDYYKYIGEDFYTDLQVRVYVK